MKDITIFPTYIHDFLSRYPHGTVLYHYFFGLIQISNG